ncbi:MAG: hypothetical protein ACQEXE_21120 [Bacillota bacterium]
MWDLQAYFAVSPANVGHLQANIKDLSAKLNDGRTIFLYRSLHQLYGHNFNLSVTIRFYRSVSSYIGQSLIYQGIRKKASRPIAGSWHQFYMARPQ